MRFYQPLAFAAIVGLVAATPVPFNEDSLAIRHDQITDPVASPVVEKREPQTQANAKGKAKAKAKGKGKGKGKAKGNAKAKGKAKAKKNKRETHEVDELIERDAAPHDTSDADTVIVSRTPHTGE